MIVSQENILNYLKKIKPELRKHGIGKLGLFGSYAKNKADIFSDIDITIECDDDFVQKNGGGLKAIVFVDKLRENISKYFKLQVDICDTTTMKKEDKNSILQGVIYVWNRKHKKTWEDIW